MSILIYHSDAEKVLRELAESSENPLHFIMKPEQAKDAWDRSLFKRHIQMVDPLHGVLNITVVFSITKGQKNGLDTLFRHASVTTNGQIPSPLVVIAVCKALGFEGDASHWHFERHPQAQHVLAIFQEYKPPNERPH